MIFIYILELENKKYYVGKTSNPGFKLEKDSSSFYSLSEWTKKYKPKRVLKIIPNCDIFDEDNYTLKYMEQHGINNVRGGIFYELKLNKDHLSTIKKMINCSIDKCYICGEYGHYEKECSQDYDNILEEFEKDYYQDNTTNEFENILSNKNLYFRFLICRIYISYHNFKKIFF